MADADCIAKLVALGSADESLQEAQHAAARKLLAMDGERYPADGCAITQSELAQMAGINVPDTYLALAFGTMLEKRGWLRIAVGQQRAGDVGSTCKSEPDHGNDHVYLVLRVVNDDEMVVADNQSTKPHMRYASGKGGKTPTTHFLRAPQGIPVTVAMPGALPGKPVPASANETALRKILDILQELVENAQKAEAQL